MLPNFGKGKPIPVQFYCYGKEYYGKLTEVTGNVGWWMLHDEYLIDVLIWKGGVTWKDNTKDLIEQEEYFTGVLLGWYQ